MSSLNYFLQVTHTKRGDKVIPYNECLKKYVKYMFGTIMTRICFILTVCEIFFTDSEDLRYVQKFDLYSYFVLNIINL